AIPAGDVLCRLVSSHVELAAGDQDWASSIVKRSQASHKCTCNGSCHTRTERRPLPTIPFCDVVGCHSSNLRERAANNKGRPGAVIKIDHGHDGAVAGQTVKTRPPDLRALSLRSFACCYQRCGDDCQCNEPANRHNGSP